MSRIQRFACCAAMGALSCLVVIKVLAQDQENDPFGDLQPGAEAQPAAAPAAEAPVKSAVAKPDAPAATRADDGALRFSFCRCAGQGSPVAVARIEHALLAPLGSNGMDFTDVPLEEVVNLLQDEYGVPIEIKESALEASGIDPSEPVTISLHKISLRSALRLMLEKLQLTYTIHDEIVEITTYDDANSHLVACVYNVRPFIGDVGDESMNSLVHTITSCIRSDTWAENGEGKAAIQALNPGLLVISQTQHAHDEIASLLNAIQKMRENSAEGNAAGSR
jgi:hypothetical protein